MSGAASACCGETPEYLARLETIYTPSKWSKRYEQEELLTRFFDFAKRTIKKSRESFQCELDVAYGNTERTKYDVYGTDLAKDAPIFVFIHGGYWQEFSKDLAGFAIPAFVESGIRVITVGYDLCPIVKLSDIVAQIKVAVEQILKYAVDSGCRSVWIAGHSAGAHLAASLLHDKLWLDRMARQGHSEVLKGLCLIAGLYNLRPLPKTSYGVNLNLTEKIIEEYSFLKVDTTDYEPIRNVKVVVVAADCDSPVIIDEAREYTQKIVTFVDNVQYIFLRDIDHFDIVEKLVEKDYALTKLLLAEMNTQ